MTEIAAPGAVPANARASAGVAKWRRSLRWFLAEFLVVVTGVIVARACNAWWQNRLDARRELVYLHQLSADLRASDKDLDDVRTFFTISAKAAATVCHEFWRRGELGNDAVFEQMMLPMRSRRAAPTLGTARAVISSGDLRVLHSSALRTAITNYVDLMDAYTADSVRYDETYFREGIHLVTAHVDIYAMLKPTDDDRSLAVRPDATSPAPFPVDLQAVLKDQDIYRGYQLLLVGHRGQAHRYGDMLDETRALQKQVDTALSALGS
jgi:hypothetical protein